MSDQMIFKRYEIKYMLTREQKKRLCHLMKDEMIADEHGQSTIQSLYFDTPDYLLIRRSLDKPFYKEKLRLRSYGVATTESNVFIELKKKYDSVVYKRRIGMTEAEAINYLLHREKITDSQIAREMDYCLDYYRELAPKVLLSYEREAFYHKADDLVITSGTYVITAARHALSGKDSVRIADGVLTLDAGTDGIHSENADKDGKGFIYIADGTITIEADSDGIDAEETLQIDGGSMTIAADDDGVHSDRDLIITDGTIDVTKSYEGLEGMTVTIEDGDISVVSSDDGLNAAGDPADASSDNSDKSDSSNNKTRPDMNGDTPPQKPDGSNNNGGTPSQRPDDSNGTPPADGNMPSGGPQDGGFGGGMDEAHDYNFIVINGGTINVNADGDGIDSNGDLIVTGGTIYVSGPTNGGNGALDYAGNAAISGGTIVAVGASGMAQNFGSDSTQGCMLVTVSESTLTGTLTLTDSDGNVIVSYSSEKAYNSVVISSPDIKKGATYTLATGDTTNTVTMSSLVYGEDDHMGR